MRGTACVVVACIAALAALTCGERPAHAYPQWQLSTGTARCNECHYAPGGGGLLTSYGRDAVGDQLSTFGGDGAFLHGAVTLPRWLAVGGDLRGAFVAHDVQDPDGPTLAVFPMQADASARVALPVRGLSLTGGLGLRGQARDPDRLVPAQNYQPISTSRLISREHYLTYQPEALGTYLRIGRFFAPFGLRFAEHNLYLRRDLGFDLLRETYNFSIGAIRPAWEVHLTVFARDFVRGIGSDEDGFAAYFERRLANDTVALGGQARVAAAAGVTRIVAGAVGKAYVDPIRTLIFAELNGVGLVFDDAAGGTRAQVIGAAGFTLLPLPSIMATLLGERNQLDVAFPNGWTAGSLLLAWFPYAHCELQAVGRVQVPTGGDVAKTLLVQLHYFL